MENCETCSQEINRKSFFKHKCPNSNSKNIYKNKKCIKCSLQVNVLNYDDHFEKCNYKKCINCQDYFPNDLLIEHKK